MDDTATTDPTPGMVAKVMRWRPWPPPLLSAKFEVRLLLRGLRCAPPPSGCDRLSAEVRWKGPKAALSSLRRNVKRSCTREVEVVVEAEEGAQLATPDEGQEQQQKEPAVDVGTTTTTTTVEWNEEFRSACTLTLSKDGVFHPWEVCIAINAITHGSKNKVSVLGTTTLNLAEFASNSGEKESDLHIPLTVEGTCSKQPPSLNVSVLSR